MRQTTEDFTTATGYMSAVRLMKRSAKNIKTYVGTCKLCEADTSPTRNILITPESTDAITNKMVSGITKSAPLSMPSLCAISAIKGN